MESTLTLNLYDLEAEVGDYAGFGIGARFKETAWSENQESRISRAVNSGVRNVYYTQEMEGVPARYDWSFLRPTSTVSLGSGDTTVPLPDDFNGMLSDSIPASGSGEYHWPIAIVGLGDLYRARSTASTTTGRPCMAYVEPIKGTAPDRSGRYRLQVYPTSDQAYSLQIWYEVAPNALTDALPFLYGGPALSECFKAAVRSSYERDFDNLPPTAPEQTNFRIQLRAAIAGDRKFKPISAGYCGDRSDDRYGWDGGQVHGIYGIPFYLNGVLQN